MGDSDALVGTPSRPGWARRLHGSLGLALVPWVLSGAVAAIVANHSSGLAKTLFGPCAESRQEAELVAERALGHLMVGASLAGERVELVEDTAAWIDADALDLADPKAELPQWARVGHLSNFELPPEVAAPGPDALLAFQIDSGGERWQCALALDGALEVASADDDDEAFGALDSVGGERFAALALVDLVGAVGLAWALSACVVLVRTRERRRSGLFALAAGTGVLAMFLTTL